MIIKNDLLGYPCLTIYQDDQMFHFSIDSMLLASFATIYKKTKNVLDFCSGNCPIPLYLTLRTEAKIDAVEIQKEVYELGRKSIEENKLENQINLVSGDIKDITNIFTPSSYDLVTCNPPFFKVDPNSNLNKNDYLTIARHEIMLNLEDVIRGASKMLKDGGLFSMIYPPTRLQEVFSLLEKYHLNATRMRAVYPKRGSECNHVLLEARKQSGKNKNLHILSPLYLYKRSNVWTKETLEIYNYRQQKVDCNN